MKSRCLQLSVLFFVLASTALASTTWYVDGVNGNDSNNCMSSTTACKTIGHAISLAASGDSIMVAPAKYSELLTINISLNIIGANANTTIIDGGGAGTVITMGLPIPPSQSVTLSGLTIQNGKGNGQFNTPGGIDCNGNRSGSLLKILSSIVSGNIGGGIQNGCSAVIINKSTISGNSGGGSGAGIDCMSGTIAINNSTISGNSLPGGGGGGITSLSSCNMTITNSTISGNNAAYGAGIVTCGKMAINNSTIANNSAASTEAGIAACGSPDPTPILQNTIVANNLVNGNNPQNCTNSVTIGSNGYNISSDRTCHFHNTGDLDATDPLLGPLQNNGGPTQTMALLPGSPAIDSGNPSGCTDGKGHLLGTDQRGMHRPDKEDTGGCDRGAYEKQSD